MCGIVGVLGNHEVAPILVEALKRLEYRGYDSAGIATINDGVLDRRRAVGKLITLSDQLVHEPLAGKSGIGHTRWATHGAPTLPNAHPHQAGRVAVVHNGIIENYVELRGFLAKCGIPFQTDTDTEIIALLTDYFLTQGHSIHEAASLAVNKLEGAFALALIFEGEDDLIFAARRGSPLAIGYGEGEMFLGSDAIALAPFTDRITYLADGDQAILTRGDVKIYDVNGAPISRPVRRVLVDTFQVEKSGHRHFMAKEIFEQPAAATDVLDRYLTTEGEVKLPAGCPDFAQFDRVLLVGCGTAHYACMVAKYWFEQIAQIPVDVDIASEFRYREPPVSSTTLAIFVSQSGETADTLAALRYCRDKMGHVLSVINVDESTIARESDVSLPIHAGIEIGVASTKAFTCQLIVLLLLCMSFAKTHRVKSESVLDEYISAMRDLPTRLSLALDQADCIRRIAIRMSMSSNVLFIGRGSMYPIALEGALKLKEVSYIHAEGYAAGELKHGPMALIDEQMPVVVLAPQDELFAKSVSNMQEILARKARVILVSDEAGIAAAGGEAWSTIRMPQVVPLLTPIVYSILAQLLAYHVAVAKGTDVDQPRNLAKSVTVE
ncbi:MAG: glutamine--fructose-6-phosphate transaminase (isomerizing) [Aestuariivita sp.]|nr:glutamine--fructose-6-phosphate transaminase (isomerizing) [Aestuariivita sp.]MCY4202727.1 glutamine--fructose-6-phosphate transaminase (isomerizing) [Aestuariivita sp.]